MGTGDKNHGGVATSLLMGASTAVGIVGVVRFARTVAAGQERVAFYAIWGLVGVIVALHALRARTMALRSSSCSS